MFNSVWPKNPTSSTVVQLEGGHTAGPQTIKNDQKHPNNKQDMYLVPIRHAAILRVAEGHLH